MNRTKFKDPVSQLCLAGAVTAFRSLTQELAGLSPFTVIIRTVIFVNEFSETFMKNTIDIPADHTLILTKVF